MDGFVTAWDDNDLSALARLVSQSPIAPPVPSQGSGADSAAAASLISAREKAALFAANVLLRVLLAERGNEARASLLRTGGVSDMCAYLTASQPEGLDEGLHQASQVRVTVANAVVAAFDPDVVLEALTPPWPGRLPGAGKDPALEAMVLLSALDTARSVCNPAAVDRARLMDTLHRTCQAGLLGTLLQQYCLRAGLRSRLPVRSSCPTRLPARSHLLRSCEVRTVTESAAGLVSM
jgi:hypothetical protein